MPKKTLAKSSKSSKKKTFEEEIVEEVDEEDLELDEEEDDPRRPRPNLTPAPASKEGAKGDVYTEEGLEEQVEEDEIAPWEGGFMEGELGEGSLANCAKCGKVLPEDPVDVFEREVNGVLKFFCSEKCAAAFEEDE